MLLEPDTLTLAPRSDELIRRGEQAELRGVFKQELFASMLELATPICRDVDEALDALDHLRATAAELAAETRVVVAAAGSHPLANPVAQEIADAERYREMVGLLGVTALRQGVNGLHVHVGMPDADACHRALEGVLPWLPLVLALSANSPYFAGEETGLASNRAEILAQLPRSGAPPPCASYADWESFVERFVRIGIVKDYTSFWWDARPHPRLGTLEIRMPDQPTALRLSGALASALQALSVTVLEGGSRDDHGRAGRGLYAQNRWAALRFGPRAELAHPEEERLVAVPELWAELRDRVEPAARRLGTGALLDLVDATACEGDRQVEIGQRDGLEAVCRDLVERTKVRG